MLVKDMLSQMQLISARSKRDLDEHDSDAEEDDDDEYDECDRAYRAVSCGEGVSREVSTLAAASRRLLEGDTQKQVNSYLQFVFDTGYGCVSVVFISMSGCCDCHGIVSALVFHCLISERCIITSVITFVPCAVKCCCLKKHSMYYFKMY